MFQGTPENGHKLEQLLSRSFHGQGIPLLISPLWLRRQGAGQVDLSRITSKGIIEILEIKCQGNWSFKQKKRLQLSGRLVSQVLKIPYFLSCYRATSRKNE